MATTRNDAKLQEEVDELKQELAALKDSIAQSAEEIDAKDVRRFLTREAKRMGFDREVDFDALRAEGARAARLVRRRPGTAVGLAAAVGFCVGLLAVRR